MSGKVFISCGQATPEERDIAAEIHSWFRERGFAPYVAIQTQSIQDVNSGIINELRTSDYYVFIDFRREQLCSEREETWRGSLFTNQELAIAYILGFNNVIFLQEEGIKLEGLLRYMGSNASRFANKRDVPELVASKDRKTLNPLDIVAVLTKVVQEQQKSLKEHQKMLQQQQETISQLKKKIADLEKK